LKKKEKEKKKRRRPKRELQVGNWMSVVREQCYVKGQCANRGTLGFERNQRAQHIERNWYRWQKCILQTLSVSIEIL
jgi:hypothetical protein